MGVLWAKSGDIARDNSDNRATGALAYFYAGGTTTPLSVYEDAGETTPHTFPLEADGNGRWPDVYIPYIATYDVKVTTSGGTELFYPTDIPNPDPVQAASDTVADDEIFSTGDLKFRFGAGTHPGFVRCNARSIGNAASSATERANADTEDLFIHLYNNFADSILAVSGGRSGVAATDFAANKRIALFDLRSSTLIGVDDMGNSASGRAIFMPYTKGNSLTVGSQCGNNTATLLEANLPSHTHAVSITSAAGSAHSHSVTGNTGAEAAHTHTGTTGIQSANHTHNYNNPSNKSSTATGVATIGGTLWNGNDTATATDNQSASHTHSITTDAGSSHLHAISLTSASESTHTHLVSGNTGTGSGTAAEVNLVQSAISGTFYIKL